MGNTRAPSSLRPVTGTDGRAPTAPGTTPSGPQASASHGGGRPVVGRGPEEKQQDRPTQGPVLDTGGCAPPLGSLPHSGAHSPGPAPQRSPAGAGQPGHGPWIQGLAARRALGPRSGEQPGAGMATLLHATVPVQASALPCLATLPATRQGVPGRRRQALGGTHGGSRRGSTPPLPGPGWRRSRAGRRSGGTRF